MGVLLCGGMGWMDQLAVLAHGTHDPVPVLNTGSMQQVATRRCSHLRGVVLILVQHCIHRGCVLG